QDTSLPTIYAITPTYSRPEQIPELTRLSQTLMHVPALHWIICEDSNVTSDPLQEFLLQLQIPYTFLLTPMPFKIRNDPKISSKPKGVAARNAGMRWLSDHNKKGVFYFMDDDNSYDLRLFSEMRWTRKVSMWPVGLVTSLALSSPILKDGRLVGWYDGFIAGRKYPVDMAGFAVSIDFWRAAGEPMMPFKTSFEEDGFLKGLKISPSDIEFKANECTKIYVWHTRTSKSPKAKRVFKETMFEGTNIRRLVKNLIVEPLKKTNESESYIKEATNMFVVK
ncbi:Glycosyl transferase family 43, partial [Trinorchestia longiramus]